MIIEPSHVIEILRAFVGTHPYLVLAIGFFVARESVFIPAIYLTLAGKLDVPTVIGLMIVMNTASDAVLYVLARFISEERLRRLVGPRVSQGITALERLFVANSLRTIFVSRFVYGTRVVVQILSGAFRVPFYKYVIVNALAIATFVGLLTGLMSGARISLEEFAEGVTFIKMGLLVIVLALIAYRALSTNVRKRWLS